MGMDRRNFLFRMAGAAAAALAATELDPDKLLWVPGKKTFFLPAEKTIIAGAEAVKELALREQSAIADAVERKTGIVNPTRYTVSTGAGRFTFDTDWMMLTANGRVVTPAEAGAYHATLFQQRDPRWLSDEQRRVADMHATRIARTRGQNGLV